MKKAPVCVAAFVMITACSKSKRELFKETDTFVESLQTTYNSYGLLGGTEHAKTTSDGLYKVTPIGRLINVKILKGSTDEEYKDLKEDLKDHYDGDSRVNDVYICNAGTVMVDCRN